jgi:hypothetical protein
LKYPILLSVLGFSSAFVACSDNGTATGTCTVNDVDGVVTLACDDGTEATFVAGADGEDGTSCTVTENGDGTTTIACDDGTEATFSDGEDGEDGEDGASCTVADNGDGTRTISCDDGTTAIVSDGADGQSCTVADNGDGTSTLSCEDGSEATIPSGSGGGGCSVADNGDGTSTITCGDGTEVVVSDGVDGQSCTVTDNGDGTSAITCGDGTEVTVSNGADGTSCTVTSNGDGTSTLSCEDGAEVTIADGADGTSCTVDDNGDGTATVSCDDGSSATVSDGVTDITLVESRLPGDFRESIAECPPGLVAVSGGARVGGFEISAIVQFSNGTGFYTSDALPASPPPTFTSRFMRVSSGSSDLLDVSTFTYSASSPFRASSSGNTLVWTHGDGVDSNPDNAAVGTYDFGSATLSVRGAGDVANLTGRVTISNDSGSFDLYRVTVDGEVTFEDGVAELGLSADVDTIGIEPDLSGYRASLYCPTADCFGTVYAVCVATP